MMNQIRQNKDKLSKKQRQKDKHANRLTDKQGDTQKYLLVKIFRYWPNFLSGSQNMTKIFSCEKKTFEAETLIIQVLETYRQMNSSSFAVYR